MQEMWIEEKRLNILTISINISGGDLTLDLTATAICLHFTICIIVRVCNNKHDAPVDLDRFFKIQAGMTFHYS